MIEPVQAQAVEKRAGLGSQQKKLDPSLEVQAGDSYKTLIQKKALARFREMSQIHMEVAEAACGVKGADTKS